MKKTLLALSLALSLFGDSADELLEGFGDTADSQSEIVDESDALLDGFEDEKPQSDTQIAQSWTKKLGLEGEFTQSMAYSYHDSNKPHDGLSSFKSTLFLEYNHALWDGFKLKLNGNAFYDASYQFKGKSKFTSEDIGALESEVELFDAYIQGSLSEKLDIKVGRQVVVWGRSDTIRITDVLNPLDNRRPAMVDIEDLRLPEGMIKFDFYHDKWRISPLVIVEERFNKNPPFGGDFYPNPQRPPKQKTPASPAYALSVAGEFSGFDVDFYLADIYAQDELGLPLIKHQKKMKMLGTALNLLHESWLFKAELAYKKDFVFLQKPDEKFDRIDTLLGFEYNGISDTKLSFDIADKHMMDKNPLFEQDTYQYALRASSDFLNATLHANYLISLFGKKLDDGGFQRVWFKYDIADGISTNVGLVDYIGGSKLFDAIDNNDMIFMDISYSF